MKPVLDPHSHTKLGYFRNSIAPGMVIGFHLNLSMTIERIFQRITCPNIRQAHAETHGHDPTLFFDVNTLHNTV